MAQGEAGGVVSLGSTADQEPASAGAPGVRGEALRALERRVGADVDPLDARRDVVLECGLAEHLNEARVRSLAALVPRHVEAPRLAPGVLDDRVEIGGLLLAAERQRARSRAGCGSSGVARHPSGL